MPGLIAPQPTQGSSILPLNTDTYDDTANVAPQQIRKLAPIMDPRDALVAAGKLYGVNSTPPPVEEKLPPQKRISEDVKPLGGPGSIPPPRDAVDHTVPAHSIIKLAPVMAPRDERVEAGKMYGRNSIPPPVEEKLPPQKMISEDVKPLGGPGSIPPPPEDDEDDEEPLFLEKKATIDEGRPPGSDISSIPPWLREGIEYEEWLRRNEELAKRSNQTSTNPPPPEKSTQNLPPPIPARPGKFTYPTLDVKAPTTPTTTPPPLPPRPEAGKFSYPTLDSNKTTAPSTFVPPPLVRSSEPGKFSYPTPGSDAPKESAAPSKFDKFLNLFKRNKQTGGFDDDGVFQYPADY